MDWRLLEGIEPWGERRADYRAARIIEAIYLANGCKPDLRKIMAMFNSDTDRQDLDDEQSEQVLGQIPKGRGQ